MKIIVLTAINHARIADLGRVSGHYSDAVLGALSETARYLPVIASI